VVSGLIQNAVSQSSKLRVIINQPVFAVFFQIPGEDILFAVLDDSETDRIIVFAVVLSVIVVVVVQNFQLNAVA